MQKITTYAIAVTTAIGTAAILGASPFGKPAGAQTVLNGNAFFPRHHQLMTGVLGPWSEAVEKATNGRVKVKIPPASMAPAPRQWDMVAKGIADVAITANVFQRRRLLLPPIAELPFTTTSGEASSVALWRTQQKFFNAADEYKGMKLLGLINFAGFNIHNSVRPIAKIEDLKGVKFWTPPGPMKAVIGALGGIAVPAPGVKIFEFVSKGTVDGLVLPFGSINTYKIGRYLKYSTVIPGRLGSASFSFFMKREKWDGLAAADRAAIESVSYEKISRSGGKAWDDGEAKGLADIKRYDIQTMTASADFMKSLRAKLAFREQGWLKAAASRGIDARAALEFYTAEGLKLAK